MRREKRGPHGPAPDGNKLIVQLAPAGAARFMR
jgi:hypothetical protein